MMVETYGSWSQDRGLKKWDDVKKGWENEDRGNKLLINDVPNGRFDLIIQKTEDSGQIIRLKEKVSLKEAKKGAEELMRKHKFGVTHNKWESEGERKKLREEVK